MKLLVISDIHSNIWALNSILEAEPDYDLLCFAGDIIDCGVAPCPVISFLQKVQNGIPVCGNHDQHAMNIYDSGDFRISPPDRCYWVNHNLELLSADQIQFIKSLPTHQFFKADGWAYLMTHQYKFASYDIIDSRTKFESFWKEHTPEEYWDAPKKRMIFGHTHRAAIYTLDQGMEWINPGSVSYRRPDDPEKSAHYMVISDGNVEIKRVAYDRRPSLEEVLRQYKLGRITDYEIQDSLFFFGDAKTNRDPLPPKEEL